MPRPSLYCSTVPDTHGTAAKPGGDSIGCGESGVFPFGFLNVHQSMMIQVIFAGLHPIWEIFWYYTDFSGICGSFMRVFSLVFGDWLPKITP